MEARYEKEPSFVYRKIADEAILVPIRRRTADLASVFVLNETAAFIWNLMDGSRTVGEIRDAVVREFDVAEEQAEADLADFVETCKQIDAVVLK